MSLLWMPSLPTLPKDIVEYIVKTYCPLYYSVTLSLVCQQLRTYLKHFGKLHLTKRLSIFEHGAPISLVLWFKNWLYYPFFRIDGDCIVAAAQHGHLHLIEYTANLPEDYKFIWRGASRGFSINIFRWLLKHTHNIWDTKTVWKAIVASARLDALEWIYQNGCPFDLDVDDFFNKAAHAGNLAVLKWAHEHGILKTRSIVREPTEAAFLFHATARGHLHVLQWAHSLNLLHPHCYQDIALGACHSNKLKVLLWLVDNLGVLPKLTWFARACKCDSLDVLQWLYEKLKPDIDHAKVVFCYLAAKNGRKQNISWLRHHGFAWDSTLCLAGTRFGNGFVKWLLTNGCPPDDDIWHFYIDVGDIDMLKWLREIRCPWDRSVPESAVKRGSIDILKWLYQEECPWNKEKLLKIANEIGDRSIAVWLDKKYHINNSSKKTTTPLRTAMIEDTHPNKTVFKRIYY